MRALYGAALGFVALAGSPSAWACEPGAVETSPGRMARPLQRPVDVGFGQKMHPILNVMKEHGGIDFAAPMGEPITSIANGVVVEARYNGPYGNYVRIRHGGDVEVAYAHMVRLTVTVGDCIEKGQVIGHVGNTGLSVGPHLHFELLRNGNAVDPEPLLAPLLPTKP